MISTLSGSKLFSKRRSQIAKSIALLISITCFTAGCGHTGNLYLPTPHHTSQKPNQHMPKDTLHDK